MKCPYCEEMLNRDSVISHLTVRHEVGLRDAMRWAGLHIDVGFAGQGDGCGKASTSSPATWIGREKP